MSNELLFSPHKAEMIQGFEMCPQSVYARLVSEALIPYKEDVNKPLPLGVSPKAFQLICITSAIRPDLWEKVAKKDLRIVQLLVDRFIVGKDESVLRADAGNVTAARISQMSREGLDILLEAVPQVPTADYPLTRKQITKSDLSVRRGRGGEASRRSALHRWASADSETRYQWLDAMNLAAHSQEVSIKRRQKAREQWENGTGSRRENLAAGWEIRSKSDSEN